MARPGVGLLASGIVGRAFPEARCRPQWPALARLRLPMARSQWRDRVGLAPTSLDHRPYLSRVYSVGSFICGAACSRGVGDQLLARAAARGLEHQDGPDAARVELELEDLRLERVVVGGDQDVVEVSERSLGLLVDAQHLRPVLGLALVVLLAVGQSRRGIGGHDDPRLGAVDAGLERPLPRGDLAVLVLCRVLAE